jgi:hypothetical protein
VSITNASLPASRMDTADSEYARSSLLAPPAAICYSRSCRPREGPTRNRNAVGRWPLWPIFLFGRKPNRADYVGLLLAAQAGYDSLDAVHIWERKAAGGRPAEFLRLIPAAARASKTWQHVPERSSSMESAACSGERSSFIRDTLNVCAHTPSTEGRRETDV